MVLAGGLVGSAVSKRLYGDDDHAMARMMAYVGAAGALTTFIGMPLAGAIFVLEITQPSAGFGAGAHDALAPAAAASIASLLTAKALLTPAEPIGGHFVYALPAAAAVGGGGGGALTGRARWRRSRWGLRSSLPGGAPL